MSGIESARFLLVVASTMVVLVSEAHADDPPPPADVAATAEALFVQGRHLAAQGRYAEACPKLEQSQRLGPGPGTLLNLADCYEKTGRLASAWIAFHEAATTAQRTGRATWAEQARQRADTLESSVPSFTVVVDEQVPGLEVRRDGVQIEFSTLGLPVPLDPGNYEVAATAPRRRRWSTRITVETGTHVVLHVPALAEETPSRAQGTTVQTKTPGHQAVSIKPEGRAASMQRAVALILGATSIVWAGTGAYLGGKAIADNNEAAARCPTSPRCTDPRAVTLTSDARREADASSAAFIAGGTLFAAAATLFLTAQTAPVRPSIGIGPRGANVAFVGSW